MTRNPTNLPRHLGQIVARIAEPAKTKPVNRGSAGSAGISMCVHMYTLQAEAEAQANARVNKHHTPGPLAQTHTRRTHIGAIPNMCEYMCIFQVRPTHG